MTMSRRLGLIPWLGITDIELSGVVKELILSPYRNIYGAVIHVSASSSSSLEQ